MTTIEAAPQTPARWWYDDFYADGGWRYAFLREWWWHRRHLVRRFGLRRGSRILEAGCGSGFHTHLLNRMGFDCVGVDNSAVGIEWARRHYPRWTYVHADLAAEPVVPTASFDGVFARGLSPYHYDLQSEAAFATTARLVEYLEPGGLFVMMIVTDLSGRRDAGKIWHNLIEDYERHFASFDRPWSVDWHKGMAICSLRANPHTNPARR